MAKQPNSVSSGGESFMVKLATFIVDKRNLFFLITIILVIFSMFSRGWVEVENDLTFYLPEDSETKKALNVMEGEFITYGTAEGHGGKYLLCRRGKHAGRSQGNPRRAVDQLR